MKTQEYLQEVLRTYGGSEMIQDRLCLSALGLAGESGEVIDSIKKVLYQGHALDRMHLIEELGDVLWYLVLACHTLDATLEEVMVVNVTKLHLRYPNGFDATCSRSR